MVKPSQLSPIPGFEGRYSITRGGRVYSHLTNQFLRNYPPRDGRVYVQLRLGKRLIQQFRIEALIAKSFGSKGLKNTEHRPVPNYPRYLLTKNGKVFSTLVNRYLSPTESGYVNLSDGGRVRAVNVKQLIEVAYGHRGSIETKARNARTPLQPRKPAPHKANRKRF